MSESNGRMVELLGELKREMNGAVSEAMERRGLHYSLNYGVSLPTIKQRASKYGVDHELAKLLWKQDVRELRISALYIADTNQVNTADAKFWSKGITTAEMSELIAMLLLSRTEEGHNIALDWLSDDDLLLRYAAIMTAARCADEKWKFDRLYCCLRKFVDSQVDAGDELSNGLSRGVARVLTRLNGLCLDKHNRLKLGDMIDEIRNSHHEFAKKITEELDISNTNNLSIYFPSINT